MKIDLHVHTSNRSACGCATEDEMVRAAVAAGLDAIAFTDHDRLAPAERLAELNDRFAPFRVFGGIEVTIAVPHHCIVLGVDSPDLEIRKWVYRDLCAFVRERGGLLALCHPFRFGDELPAGIDEAPPDAIELRSVHIPAADEGRIWGLASRLGATLLCNSDAHKMEFVGIYSNDFDGVPGWPADGPGLVELLRKGTHSCAADIRRLELLDRPAEERDALVRAAAGRGGAQGA